MAELSPFQQMQARKAGALKTGRPRGRQPLSEPQRTARKKAEAIVRRRALAVFIDNHRDEWNSLLRAERHVLYASIDAQYEAGQDIVLPRT